MRSRPRLPSCALVLRHVLAAFVAFGIAWAVGLAWLGLFPWLTTSLLVVELRRGFRPGGGEGHVVLRRLAVRALVLLALLTVGMFVQAPGMTPRFDAAPGRLLWQLSVVLPFVHLSMYLHWAWHVLIAALALPTFMLAFAAVRVPATVALVDFGIDWTSERFVVDGDGVELVGTRCPLPNAAEPPTPPRGYVLVVHGIGAERHQFLAAVRALRREGFEIWSYDQRGHGESGGFASTFGSAESRDLAAFWSVLQQRVRAEAPNAPCLVYGISLGGAAAQLAAADGALVGLDGLVLDSTFASLREVGAGRIPFVGGLLYALLETLRFDVLVLGRRVLDRAPVDAVGSEGPPVLIFHNRGDPLIPVGQSHALAEAYGSRAELVELDGSGHATGFAEDPWVHDRALLPFVERLGRPR